MLIITEIWKHKTEPRQKPVNQAMGMMQHSCHTSGVTGPLPLLGVLVQKLLKSHLRKEQKSWRISLVAAACNLSYVGGTGRRSKVPGQPQATV
jgi:hypothetical protein